MSRDAHDAPITTKRSPAPLCHAATPQKRKRFKEAYRSIVSSFRSAAERLKNGERDVEFPPGCFPPHLPFVLTAHAFG